MSQVIPCFQKYDPQEQQLAVKEALFMTTWSISIH